MICIVFYDSGVKRTLCGSKWDPVTGIPGSLTGDKNAFDNLGSGSGASTARHGCCPAGKYMSNPEVNPFSISASCDSCVTGKYAPAVAIQKSAVGGIIMVQKRSSTFPLCRQNPVLGLELTHS